MYYVVHKFKATKCYYSSIVADGLDYTSTSITVTYAPGDVMQCITIPILEDMISEDPELFNVMLSSDDPNVVSNVPVAGVTITDEGDSVTVELEMDVYPTSEDLGVVQVCVVVSEGELDREITVTLATSPETAEGRAIYCNEHAMVLLFITES